MSSCVRPTVYLGAIVVEHEDAIYVATTVGQRRKLSRRPPLRPPLRMRADRNSQSPTRRRLLAPFLSPFLVGKTFVADVINYVAGLIFSTIKPVPR